MAQTKRKTAKKNIRKGRNVSKFKQSLESHITFPCFSQTCDNVVEIRSNGSFPFHCDDCESTIMAVVQQEHKDTRKEVDVKCPKCKGKMVIRHGRSGKFYGCSRWSKEGCTGTRSI